MENRIRRILLNTGAGVFSVFVGLLPAYSYAAEPQASDESELKPAIQPEITRTEFKEAKIDTENFEIGAFAGYLSTGDFGTNPVYGTRLAYHITEDLFVEGAIGSSKAGKTSYERFVSAPLLTDSQRELLYYNLSLAINILPGEAFLTQTVTYNTAFYLIGGVGSTEFAGADRFTINFGFGYRVFATDYLSIRADVRDHIFNMDVFGTDETTHNIEMTLGVSMFF